VKHHAPARRTVSAPGIFIAVVATAWVVAATGVAWARSPGLAFPAAGGSSASVIHGFGSLTDYTYTVDSTGDGFDTTNGDHLCIASTGGCTLRAAIQQDNFNCGAVNATSTTIDFSIGTGGQTIAPLTALPTIACPTTVDGTTQPGYAGSPIIVLNGTNTNPNLAGGLALFNRCNCGGSLRGLVINGFDGDKVQLENGGPYTVQGNYFGTDVTGTMPVANRGDGVHVTANDGVGDLIGGTAAGDGNVISGNDFYGVAFDQSSSNNLLQGNLIGTDITGTKAVPNGGTTGQVGVSVNGVNQTIGGTVAGAGNLISGNAGDGISVFGSQATHAVIEGNLIGSQGDGIQPLGNAGNGIHLQSTGPDTVGGTGAGQANVIAFNGHDGVLIDSGGGHDVSGNSIFSNGTTSTGADKIGIDLSGCGTCAGVTPNDVNDVDTGANNFQNFPVLISAVSGFSSTVVKGSLNSTANTGFTVQFFSSPTCDPSGNGEGQTFLGSTFATTVGNNASFSAKLPGAVAPGQVITSTATDPSGNTSEFSACRVVTGAQADLAVTNADSPDPDTVGSPLTYTIRVTDGGPATATGVSVTDALPSSETFVSSSSTQGTCSGTTKVVCSLGTLAQGASATVTIVVTPNAAGKVRDKATVKATQYDPNMANDSAKAVTTVNP